MSEGKQKQRTRGKIASRLYYLPAIKRFCPMKHSVKGNFWIIPVRYFLVKVIIIEKKNLRHEKHSSWCDWYLHAGCYCSADKPMKWRGKNPFAKGIFPFGKKKNTNRSYEDCILGGPYLETFILKTIYNCRCVQIISESL